MIQENFDEKQQRTQRFSLLCHFSPSFYQNEGHFQIAQELLRSPHQSVWPYQMTVAAVNKHVDQY
jgi:hypothetical protein